MPKVLNSALSKNFRQLAESLDIPESAFELAEKRYQSIANWLEREESRVKAFNPEIYPQGSFRLGTVTQPISEAYDVDLVCELSLDKGQVSQERLKELVGYEIKAYARAKNIKSPVEEKKRCWSLNYADETSFHMDILPAIPDGKSFKEFLELKGYRGLNANDLAGLAIAITDKTLTNYKNYDTDWPRSNPKGFAEWFRAQMETRFKEARMQFAESIQARVEDIPDYKVKTPLQRAIQILKRHRDIMFVDDPDDKPISIIITTLAAHAYNNEGDVLEALVNIVNNMPRYIETVDGVVKWVKNPVNPDENFADKWREHPQRERKFRGWLKKVQTDLDHVLKTEEIRTFSESLRSPFADSVIKATPKRKPETTEGLVKKSSGTISRFDVPHREKPIWPVQRIYNVTLSGHIKKNGKRNQFGNHDRPLSKHCDLFFYAETNTPRPFEVFWQVVNTGEEAKHAHDLRGEIFRSKTAGVGGISQKESTRYPGYHYIECFIVKDGVCVARSGEFVIHIE